MAFREVLESLLACTPLARGVVFCDFEGERVEAVLADPELDPYELDLAGASYAGAVEHLSSREGAQIRVLHERGVVWVQPVCDGYYMVLLVQRTGVDGWLRGPLRAAGEALRALM